MVMEKDEVQPLLSLPIDVWCDVTKFLEISDLLNLFTTNKAIHACTNNDAIFQLLCQQRYPNNTLNVSRYQNNNNNNDGNSDIGWKAMLRDGNSKNGIYMLQLSTLAGWRYNYNNASMNTQKLFYMTSARFLIWDKLNQKVGVAIEAYGENDLREIVPTTFFRIVTKGEDPKLDQLPIKLIQPSPYNSPSFQKAIFWISQDDFMVSDDMVDTICYKYNYNGSVSIRKHIEFEIRPSAFLEVDQPDDITAISKLFSLKKPNCHFVPHEAIDHILQPSDITTWKGIVLPKSKRRAYQQRVWGCPSY